MSSLESEITIRDQITYQYNVNYVWNKGEGEFTTTLIIFDYYDWIISFLITTLSDSDKDYSSDFENVLDSIEYTEQTIQEIEKEEIVEESNGNEIVIGEPIHMGDYTINIQGYSLGWITRKMMLWSLNMIGSIIQKIQLCH